MICSFCNNPDFQPGLTSITMEREGRVLIIRDVPALCCTLCGEGVVEADVADQILDEADEAFAEGRKEVVFKQAA